MRSDNDNKEENNTGRKGLIFSRRKSLDNIKQMNRQ